MLPERAICFFIILAATLVGVVWGLIVTRRVIEAPFLYAVGMLLILCPQLYMVAGPHAWRVPTEAYWVFNIMAVLCTVALYLGYFPKPRERVSRKRLGEVWTIDPKRLYTLGFITAVVGQGAAYKYVSVANQATRGWPTYWITLSGFLIPGITLMLIAYVHKPTRLRLIPIVLFSYYPMTWIVEGGRRSATLVLPIIYILPFLLYKKKFHIPRLAIVGGLVVAFVVAYAFPTWRLAWKEHEYLQSFRDYPLTEVLANTFSENTRTPTEIGDGMIVTGARFQLGNYEYGMSIYNMLVQDFVPGTLIGYDRKDALRVGAGVSHDWVQEVYGIPVKFYTAKSGYEDVFSEFSFLGCIIFYWIGKGFRRAHDAATLRNDGRAVIFLCFFVSFPATLAYGSLVFTVIGTLPTIVYMFLAFRWCLTKQKIEYRLVNPAFVPAVPRFRGVPVRQRV
jgi:hypothetical protein